MHCTKDRHNFSPPWEGPFFIAEVLRPGTYKLQTTDGEVFTNAGNIEQLCCFYKHLAKNKKLAPFSFLLSKK